MRLPPERRLDLLALVACEKPMAALLEQLRGAGYGVDVVKNLKEAREAFFANGGHHLVLLGPDVPPGLAQQILAALREVDSDMPAIVFGADLARARLPGPIAVVQDFHPSSRAGWGSLLRLLREMPERA